MLDRYDTIHHYEGDYFDSNRTPVYEEVALWPELGYKKIVSVDYFVLKMLKELNGVKYLYDSIIEGCLLAVSHKYWIKCNEEPRVVLNRAREALKIIFDTVDTIAFKEG